MSEYVYEFQEFPKWVTVEGAEPVLVADAEEEKALFATVEPQKRKYKKSTVADPIEPSAE